MGKIIDIKTKEEFNDLFLEDTICIFNKDDIDILDEYFEDFYEEVEVYHIGYYIIKDIIGNYDIDDYCDDLFVISCDNYTYFNEIKKYITNNITDIDTIESFYSYIDNIENIAYYHKNDIEEMNIRINIEILHSDNINDAVEKIIDILKYKFNNNKLVYFTEINNFLHDNKISVDIKLKYKRDSIYVEDIKNYFENLNNIKIINIINDKTCVYSDSIAAI